jgi:hypothetical protein
MNEMSESFVVNHTTATLSEARHHLAATSSGELVFFAGGQNATEYNARVDILNVSSGIWTTTTLSLNLGKCLQPHPHEILSSLVEVIMGYIRIELIFTTFQVEVGALQLSLNLVQVLQPHQLEILFYSVEVFTAVLKVIRKRLMCTM